LWAVEGIEAQACCHGVPRLTYAEVVFHTLGELPASLGFMEIKEKGDIH
jgi:hypothetical protein